MIRLEELETVEYSVLERCVRKQAGVLGWLESKRDHWGDAFKEERVNDKYLSATELLSI